MQPSSCMESLCSLGDWVFLTPKEGHRGEDNPQLSMSRLGCYVSRLQIPSLRRGEGAGACVTSQDVLKAAWKGINVSIHYLVPILLPRNGSRKPDGIWRSFSGYLWSPLPNPAGKPLSRAAHR